MHKNTKITTLTRRIIYKEYRSKIKKIKIKELAEKYNVHRNTISKIIARGRIGDFTIHRSTIIAHLGHRFKDYVKKEKKLFKKINREKSIFRYEKSMTGELVHIDIHKQKNIKGEDPRKKKYWAGVIDDATRITYVEVLSDKKAKTLSSFMKRAYQWFKLKGIIIKKLLSDNGLEFTTHHIDSRPKHSFEIILSKLGIIHKYTKVRRPQTNGKIERLWRIINEEFFFKNTFLSHKDFCIKFKDWLCYYNQKRKHGGIRYMTPMQKLDNLLKNKLVCVE